MCSLSHAQYGLLAWGGAPKTHLNKVSRSLKQAVRVMKFKNKYESTMPFFEYLNIVPFDINLKVQQGKFMKQLSSTRKYYKIFPFKIH